MMKRLLLVLLALVVCIPSVQARRKTAKAGVIKDGVYEDAVYNFKIDLPKEWILRSRKKTIRSGLS